MQTVARCKNCRRHNATGCRSHNVADSSQNAQSENDESGDDRGDAVIFVLLRFLPLASNIDEAE